MKTKTSKENIVSNFGMCLSHMKTKDKLRKMSRAWTNDKCLATKHHQTLFGDQTFYRLDTLFGTV